MRDHQHFGRSSLLLASHDRAHREHMQQHHLLHRADPDVVGAIVTEVVATVSVVHQVTVNIDGITIGQYTYTADSTGGTSFPPTTTENATSSTTAASPGTSSLGSTASSTAGSGPGDQLANTAASSSQSLLSIQNSESASAATPISPTPISSIPTTFASILASNSTSLIPVSSATSLTPNLSNSSISSSTLSDSSSSSSSSSSSVFTNLQSSSTISDESTTSLFASSSSVFSSGSSSSSPTATATDGIIGGGAGTGSGDTSSATAAAGSGRGSNSAPSTSTLVGSLVGGIAGAAILIFLVTLFIRWKRRNPSMLALGEGEGATDTSRSIPPPTQPPEGMAERSSFAGFTVPAALASLTGYKRSSQRTADRNTVSSTAGSEIGFYRVSGRKLPSVLQSGGDGYGGGIMDSNTMSGSSFYRDSQGFYGGPGAPSSPMARDSGVPIMREGPARTPVTEHGPFANPPVSPAPPPPPRRPDVLGRSHSSFDGLPRSRFTEEV